MKAELTAELNLKNVRLIAPATHDTGSAVAGLPIIKNEAYISSGTWSLVGIERGEALINQEVVKENFTNEGGVFGTVRFLKNVVGLWIFESCRQEWEEIGLKNDYSTLLDEVGRIEDFCGFIFPDDARFLHPSQMISAIETQLKETGQKIYRNPVYLAKIILDSLAFRYASILKSIEKLTGDKLAGVLIGGGGGRNQYLNQMTANASGLKVKAGLAEATVTGNLVVQAIASGRFSDLSEARKYVAQNIKFQEFSPKAIPEWVRKKYAEIETKFLNQ